MSKKPFQEGLKHFKLGKYSESIEQLTLAIQALKESEVNAYLIYDTRSAAYAKLGNNKAALIDARKTIQIAPERWQGYARAARLFLAVDKIDASLSMITLALQRLKDGDEERKSSLLALRTQVEERQLAMERRQKRLTNHISKLPVELLTEVFQTLVTEDSAALIPLLHVCTHWRQILKFSPRFWSILILGRKKPKEKAAQWIKYSKGRIRELKVKPGLSSATNWPSESLRGLKWDSLSKCELHQWSISSYLHSISQPGAITNLTSLFIDCDPYEPDFDKGFVFAANPQLQHLALHNVPLRSIVPEDDINLSQLLSLSLNNCDLDGPLLHRIVSCASNLQTLQLEFSKITQLVTPADVPSLILPNLSTLHLRCLRSNMFASTDLPSLRILRLYDIVDSVLLARLDAWSHSIKLTELALTGTPIQPPALLRILQASTELQKLEVCKRDNLMNDILTQLSGPAPPTSTQNLTSSTSVSVPVMCPLLTDVNFSDCKDVRTGPLVKFIKSRHPEFISPEIASSGTVVKPVQSLVINGCHLVDAEWLEWMRTKVPRVSCIYMKKSTKFR
ncbi:hypothetical protein CVT24_007463 [Panaeolus cyanescens]|uniref:F-box domain-containing protein n=1 Tax=Panaeolus cyanescens TaxID=181874 RepID=A0A409W506_9AGAR|nr:hypothetical protein CVT24_007463 [Panaeolus cyanescens]